MNFLNAKVRERTSLFFSIVLPSIRSELFAFVEDGTLPAVPPFFFRARCLKRAVFALRGAYYLGSQVG